MNKNELMALYDDDMKKLFRSIYEETIRLGREILQDPEANITVRFSAVHTTQIVASCYPNQWKIIYYAEWIILNPKNTQFIHDLIVHECAHLRYAPHNKKFRDLCASYGALHEGYNKWEYDDELNFPKHNNKAYNKL